MVNAVFLVKDKPFYEQKLSKLIRERTIYAQDGEKKMIFSVLHAVSDPLFKKMGSSKQKKKKLYTNFLEVSVATSKLTNKSERRNGQFLKSGQIELEWHVRSQFNKKLLQVWLLVKLESKNNSYTIEPHFTDTHLITNTSLLHHVYNPRAMDTRDRLLYIMLLLPH